MFVRATITLGIDPHSSFCVTLHDCCKYLDGLSWNCEVVGVIKSNQIKSKFIVKVQDATIMYKHKNIDEIDIGTRLQGAYKYPSSKFLYCLYDFYVNVNWNMENSFTAPVVYIHTTTLY